MTGIATEPHYGYLENGSIRLTHSERTFGICEERANARWLAKRLLGIPTESVDRLNDALLDLPAVLAEAAVAILLGGKMLQKPGPQARTEHWGVEVVCADGRLLRVYVKSRTAPNWDFLVPNKYGKDYFTADIGVLVWTHAGPRSVDVVGYLTRDEWEAGARQVTFGRHLPTWVYPWQDMHPLVELEPLLGRPLRGRP